MAAGRVDAAAEPAALHGPTIGASVKWTRQTVDEFHMNPIRPRISIITACLNEGSALERTLVSVIQQAYSNGEHLVADGGSTDGTVELLTQYDDEITWWQSEPDAGRTDAIHQALQRATGDLVMILDAGDILMPGALGNIADRARLHGAFWMIGPAQIVDDRGVPIAVQDDATYVWRRHLVSDCTPSQPVLPVRFEQLMALRLLRTGQRPEQLGGITVARRQSGTMRLAA